MSPTFLASFPNSRVKPRSATSSESPSTVTVKPAGAGTGPLGTTVVNVADPNFTFLTIENMHATDSMAFGFDPATLIAHTKEFVLKASQAIDDESPETMYGISLTANDIPVQLLRGVG